MPKSRSWKGLSNSRLFECGAVWIVVCLAALPFLQLYGFSFLNYDDPLHVSAQPSVLGGLSAESVRWSVTATPSNLWHPLTWLSYMVEVSLFGGGANSPGVHHVGNLVLHLGATVFFFLLLRSLRISLVVAVVVAVLFSLHPLHVEPVAWISSRKDVLCVFFCCVSLFCYSHLRENLPRRSAWFWMSWFAFAAAIASKPSAVVLPGIFLLLDYFPRAELSWVNRNGFIRLVVRKWPYLILATLAVLVAVLTQYSGTHSEFVDRQGVWSRLSYLPASIAFYIQHVLWPRGLTFEYAAPQGGRFVALSVIGAVLLVAISGLSWKLRKRCPVVSIAWLWFLFCLAPVLGLFYVGGGFTADRYTYLALAGPALALAYGVDALKGRLFTVGVSVLVCLAILCAVHSYEQTKVWKDDSSLFTHGVRVEPRSATAQTNLASLYRFQNRDDLALAHYQKALKLDGSYYIIHYNIAQIQLKQSQFPEAMESCEMSLRSNPGYVRSHYLLAKLMEEHADTPEQALNHFKMAHELEANNARNAISYALALARRKQYDEAHAVLQGGLQVETIGVEDHIKINALIKKLEPWLSK